MGRFNAYIRHQLLKVKESTKCYNEFNTGLFHDWSEINIDILLIMLIRISQVTNSKLERFIQPHTVGMFCMVTLVLRGNQNNRKSL